MKDKSSTLPSSAAAEEIGYNNYILTEIFRRLPAKPLFRFKMVSKSWHNLISNTDWSVLWKPKPTSGLYMCKYAREYNRNIKFHFIPLDGDLQSKPSSKPLERSLAFIKAPVQILQSCNGLFLCCSPEATAFDQGKSIYYICNPVTKQFTTLPRPHGHPVEGTIRCINLAVDFSKSLEYKVVAISYHSGRVPVSRNQVEVYSSKTRSWKFSGGTFEAETHEIDYESGAYWKSALHWPSFSSETAPYFDVDKECLGVMPMPPFQTTNGLRSFSYFGESNGHLLLIDFDSGRRVSQFSIFEMKDDYSEWFVKYRVNLYAVETGLPKADHHSVGKRGPYFQFDSVDVLSLVRREDDDESFMVLHKNGICIAYNLIMGTSTRLCDLPLRRGDSMELMLKGWRLVHHFIETPFWV